MQWLGAGARALAWAMEGQEEGGKEGTGDVKPSTLGVGCGPCWAG